MRSLPQEFVIFDTEYTAWEGSQERNWGEPWEHREIIQIGAVRVKDLVETDFFFVFVKPEKNPKLSEYIINLTGITQTDIETKGLPYPEAQHDFYMWTDGLPIFSYGNDCEVLKENSTLSGISFPFDDSVCGNIKTFFEDLGVHADDYMSSTIPKAFGVEPPPHAHNALSDARSILLALKAAYVGKDR